MAVYTEVSDEALEAFLAGYDLGRVLSFKGIAEGVENSNFLLHADAGQFILTLYEKRVKRDDLPFFLGLMEHLAAARRPCPLPVQGDERRGARAPRRPAAAIVTFLDGVWLRRPQAEPLRPGRRGAGALHVAGADFRAQPRPTRCPSAAGRRCSRRCAARRRGRARASRRRSTAELAALQAIWPRGLPGGVIHADLFPDNVFFLGESCPA